VLTVQLLLVPGCEWAGFIPLPLCVCKACHELTFTFTFT
jgi:hypothetical protein